MKKILSILSVFALSATTAFTISCDTSVVKHKDGELHDSNKIHENKSSK